ncbi:hypothetical protein ACC699_17185 [Rhizobium ruizarguesonis]
MQVVNYISKVTGKPLSELFDLNNPLVVLEQSANGQISITAWSDNIGVSKPSSGDIAAALSAEEAPTVAQVDEKIASIFAGGAPAAGGLHISLSDGSRSDMGAMATTALAAISGAVEWPQSYAQGWITIENIRIALASPAEGLVLAASVGAYYAAVVQHGRDLKDAILAATDDDELGTIDIGAGWP